MPVKSLLAGTVIAAAAATNAYAASFVTNGSFENGAFVNTVANYMTLSAGATTVTGWTVSAATTNAIAWGINPTDGNTAAAGAAFIDLSGLGSSSPNGAVEQNLATTPGQQYTFSFDFSGSLSTVKIGSLTLSLALGSTFSTGGTSWTAASATFVAPSGSQLLSIANTSPGSQIVFIDDVSVTGADTSATPVPAAWPLFGSVLGAAGFIGWRRKRRQHR